METLQEVPGRVDDTALLRATDAGGRTTVSGRAAGAHFDEHQRAVVLAQNQVDLAAARPRPGGHAIITLHQPQALAQQMGQRERFGLVADPLVPCLRRPTQGAHAVTTFDASLLLQAASSAAGAQLFPAAALYVVATPIGNLADLTLRAIHTLALVDAVACEDTRHSAPLLRALGLDKTLIAVHQHNEREAARGVLARLARGERVAYVSDAGTPGISDPGAALVDAVRGAGHRCIPLPGASSAAAALSVAGDPLGGPFVFIGFLPARGAERGRALADLAADGRTQVLFEAPHRIGALAQSLAESCVGRRISVCRELTKQFETIETVQAAELPAWLSADPNRSRGEFVLVLHALAPALAQDAATAHDAMLRTLLAELPLKQAVALATELSGAPRNSLYERALALKQG